MEISNINLVYFSATYTTRKVVKLIADEIGTKVTEFDITQATPDEDVMSGNEDLLVVGMPVYAGRIPAGALSSLNRLRGNGTPAIIVCVYGNRDYDDALLELKDAVEANGFKVVSCGVFIARHSIFPQVGQDRPDSKDVELIKEFAVKSADIIKSITDISSLAEIKVKGNNPYKVPGKLPLKPTGERKCNKCGTCVKLCPAQAIPADTPRKTEKERCIACGRCIVVCPQNARHFGGILYKLAGKKFIKAYMARKEPEMVFVGL